MVGMTAGSHAEETGELILFTDSLPPDLKKTNALEALSCILTPGWHYTPSKGQLKPRTPTGFLITHGFQFLTIGQNNRDQIKTIMLKTCPF